MNQKAVFFDVDGTLYDRANGVVSVPDSAVNAISQLMDNGHLAFICTGRPLCIVDKELTDIGFQGIIGGLGTCIEYMGQRLHYAEIEKPILEETLQYFKKNRIHVIVEGHEGVYFDEVDIDIIVGQGYKEFLEDIGGIAKTLQDKTLHASKYSVYIDNKDWTGEDSIIRDNYNLIRYDDQSAELVLKGYSKAEGIKRICRHLGIDVADTYAFGDSMNDFEMLSYVRYGIAMGNSSPQILSLAKYQTTSVKEDGIYTGLKHFNLI